MNNIDIDSEQFFCIIGILCIATDNYAYSKDKYPYDIYQYFSDILTNKMGNIFVANINEKVDRGNKRIFVRSDTENIKYNWNDNLYFVDKSYIFL